MPDIYGADKDTWDRVARGVKIAESMGGQGSAMRRGPRDEGGSSVPITTPTPGIITSASNGIYGVDLYANGYTQASTGSGYLIALELSYGETVPIGTKVIVSPWQLTATGSGD